MKINNTHVMHRLSQITLSFFWVSIKFNFVW